MRLEPDRHRFDQFTGASWFASDLPSTRIRPMPKKVCISIAVSKPEKLDALPGAITASHDVLAWARAAGFTTPPAVTDEDGSPGTGTRLNAALMPIVGDGGGVIDHLIIPFSGHRNAGEDREQVPLLYRRRPQP